MRLKLRHNTPDFPSSSDFPIALTREVDECQLYIHTYGIHILREQREERHLTAVNSKRASSSRFSLIPPCFSTPF